MASNVTFATSEKGNKKVCYEGFVYNYQKENQSTINLTFWICEQYHKSNCKARVHLQNNEVIKQIGDHNHAPNGLRKLVSTHIFFNIPVHYCPMFVIYLVE